MVVEHFIGIKSSEKFLRKHKARLYQDILKNPNLDKRTKIYTNDDITVSDFSIAKNHAAIMKGPLLFKQAARTWPCITKWNKPFRNNYADYDVLVGNIGLATKRIKTIIKLQAWPILSIS